MTGPSVIAVEMRQAIQDDVWRLSLFATLLVTTFLFVSYRSVSVLALTLLPLASAILAGIVAVSLVFGSIHGMTLAFGITLLGVVDDYPIHLFSHLTKESRAPAVMKEIWPTMRLGVVATALGFSCITPERVPWPVATRAVRDGRLVHGRMRDPLGSSPHRPHRISHETRRAACRTVGRCADKSTTCGPAGSGHSHRLLHLVGYATMGAGHCQSEPDLDREKERDQVFRNELGVPDVRDLIVVEGSSEEDALQRSEALALALDPLVRNGELAGYDLAARYLPSRKTQQARQACIA